MNRLIAGWLVLAATFGSCLAGYLWRNDFPFFYHPDEESKMLQIVQHYRNFWHPLLLVNGTEVWVALSGTSGNDQGVTHAGRVLSAWCAAVAVTAAAGLAWRRHGLMTAVIVALFLGTFPMLFEIAHFMKEDTVLLMGLALGALALDLFMEKPNKRRAFLLAASVAIAFSAKYLGAIFLPVALAAAIWRRQFLVFFGSVLALTLAINWQWLVHFPEVLAGLHRETDGVGWGSGGKAYGVYWKLFELQVGLPVAIIACAGLGIAAARRLKFDIGVALFGIALFAGLSLATKTSDRYLLPVVAVTFYFLAMALTHIAGRWAILLAVALWMPQSRVLATYVVEFQRDSRAELVAWMDKNLPPDAKVATSLWTRLPGRTVGQFKGEPQPLEFVADRGSVANLKAEGFRYVVIADPEANRFLDQATLGGGPAGNFARRREFYQTLTRGKLLWKSAPGWMYVLNPGLQLYELPDGF
ncbi:MAG TPA: glycosyltransferase family 39 protein [Chthoniobacterales bacterium]